MKEEYTSYKLSKDFHLLSSGKSLSYDIFESLLSFLCFYPFAAFLCYMVNFKKDDILDGVFMLLPILAMTYAGKKIKNSFIYAAAILLITVFGVAAMWTEGLMVYRSIFLISYTIYSVVKKVKNKNTFISIGQLIGMNIFIAFSYGFSLLFKAKTLQSFIFTFAVIHLILSLIYIYWSSSDKLLQWEKCSDKKHVRLMKNINIMFSIVMIIIVSAILFLSWQGGIFKGLDAVWGNIYKRIFKFVYLVNISENDFMDMENPIPPQIADIVSADPNTGLFFKLMVLFIKTAFIVVIAVDIILIAQYIYRSYLKKKNTVTEEREFLVTRDEFAEKLKQRVRKSLNLLKRSVYKTNREKIRRIYYLLVMKHNKAGVRVEQHQTPVEIENNIESVNNAKLSKATDIYEKARYSPEDLTDEQVKEIKKFLSGK